MDIENTDDRANYEIWDEFLKTWPVDRVKSMTLAEYNQVGNRDTFCAWVENRTDSFGSIWGGSSFKFGIYNRKDISEKESHTRYDWSEDYAWEKVHGTTPESAFKNVKRKILEVMAAVESANLEPIEEIKLWPVFKWKIASLYQERQNPLLPCVFRRNWIGAYLGELGSTLPLPALYEKVMTEYDGDDILGFSQTIWRKAQEILSAESSSTGPSTRKYWMYAPGEKSSKWEEFYSAGIMAIGWDQLGDLTLLDDKADISDHFRKVYNSTGSAMNDVLANYQFRDVVSIGDIVIPKNGRTEYLGYGVVSSDYYFDEDRDSFKHCHDVFWKKKGVWIDPKGDIVLKTITDITKYPDYVERISKLIGIEREEEATMVLEKQQSPINKIFYGPPGTGKTYKLQKYYLPLYSQSVDQVSEAQWLASKIEGLTWLEVIGATIFDLGGKAKVADIKAHRFFQLSDELRGHTNKNLNSTIWGNLMRHTVADCEAVKATARETPEWFSKDQDSVWSFAGDWIDTAAEIRELVQEIKNGPQSNDVAADRFEFVTFHQSYSYEEFVEGIRPVLSEEDSDDAELSYTLEAGVFKRICMRAERDPDNRYAIFIDEINRGNISKIFGELITLIEPDKRLGCSNALRVTLPYSKKPFGVPRNLDIYATMNTADKSLAYLDTALRRRFSFEELLPDPSLLRTIKAELDDQPIDLEKLLQAINKRLEILLDRDHTIGHSNFMADDIADLPIIFKDRLLPQLTDFFFEDWEKVRMVLADDQVSDNRLQFIVRKQVPSGLFKPSDSLTSEVSYELNQSALQNPLAYQKIYQPTQDSIEG
jgi:5-methylcytosine-specific restriction protein B